MCGVSNPVYAHTDTDTDTGTLPSLSIVTINLHTDIGEDDAAQPLLDLLGRGLGLGRVQHGDVHGGRQDGGAGRHQDLSQAGDSQGDVHLSATSKVKGVERHLGGGLSDRLLGRLLSGMKRKRSGGGGAGVVPPAEKRKSVST